MRVLFVHNRYRHEGGEERAIERDAGLLRGAGHDVHRLDASPAEWDALSSSAKARTGAGLVDHRAGRTSVRSAIEAFAPDVVHFHNLFPSFGFGAIEESLAAGLPTVWTLHNYRLTCVAGTHVYDGRRCTECRLPGRGAGVYRGCYRGSIIQSWAYTRAMREAARRLAVTPRLVVVAVSAFQRDWLVARGIPEAERFIVRPNPAPRGERAPYADRCGAVMVGRLSAEKGAVPLARAWDPSRSVPLQFVGDGPERSDVMRVAEEAGSRVALTDGTVDPDRVAAYFSRARVAVLGSTALEASPLAVSEAFSHGTPVVTFAGGAAEEAVSAVDLMLVVPAGDYAALASLAEHVATVDESAWSLLSARASDVHASMFSPEVALSRLLGIYRAAGALYA